MAKVEVTMPKMGESITEGTVIEWLKQPGDTVEMDEPLLEIGTDKVDTEVPSPQAGVLEKILVEAGDTVEVGTAIAILETDADAADAAGGDGQQATESVAKPEPAAEPEPAAAEPEPAAAEPEPAAAEPEPAAAEPEPAPKPGAAPTPNGKRVEVHMPKMGESITEGTVLSWAKQVGDAIELDETLLEIATDKVDTEVPAPAAGVLQEICVEEGETVDVGTLIAVIGSEGVAAAPSGGGANEQPSTDQKTARESSQPAQPAAPAQPAGPIARTDDEGRFYSPLVRSIAEAEGVSMSELKQIKGSGREGRVTKADLMTYLESRGSAPAAAKAPAAKGAPSRPAASVASTGTPATGERVEVVKMDRMRQIIAEHMTRSKATSAHVTSFAEIDASNLVRLREKNKAAFQKREGIKLTYTPFFVQAAVQALKEHPILNSSVDGDTIVYRKDFHIGIAVAIGTTGLLAPVIRDAGQRNLTGLAHAAADLAMRARSKQLLPDHLAGGTFTVTNVGSLGSVMGTPIINQPQVAILATGAIKKRPVVIEDPVMGDVIAVRHMMMVSLSYDHRIIDGSMGSSFLRAYTDALEGLDPDAEI